MAENSTDSLITPAKIEYDDMNVSTNSAVSSGYLSNERSTNSGSRRASFHGGDRSVRNSTGKPDSAIPHYLRASTGSCHDFCKYGHKHSSEEKARKPIRKRIAKPNEPHVQIVVSGEQTKKMSGNQKTPKDTKTNDSPDVKPSPDAKSCSPKLKTSLDEKRVVKPIPTKNGLPELPSSGSKSYLQKSKTPSDAKASSSEEKTSSGKKTVLPKYKRSSNRRLSPPDPPEVVKSVVFLPKKVEDPTKKGASPTEKKTMYVPKQHSSQVKLKPVKVKDNMDAMAVKGRRKSSAETSQTVTTSKVYTKKVLARPVASSSPKVSIVRTSSIKSRKAGNVKLLSPQKDQKKTCLKTKTSNHEMVSEKTLHVIKTETLNNVSESIPEEPLVSSHLTSSSDDLLSQAQSSLLSSNEEDNKEIEQTHGEAEDDLIISDDSESMEIEETDDLLSQVQSSLLSSNEEDNKEIEQTHGEAEDDLIISDDSESMEIEETPIVKENHNKTPRKSKVVVSEDKSNASVKVKFRSGKVVDIQSDNNTPRRLRFRRARALGTDDSKGDSRRRTFKKVGPTDASTGGERSSEKVILKHQDVQGKKDAQGLFNNVIEETASKLVESRKSKVKALVGAFETVISLQESKPSSQAISW